MTHQPGAREFGIHVNADATILLARGLANRSPTLVQGKEVIHVIEYSAYLAVCAELERLKSYASQFESTLRETMKVRDELAARVAELEECLKHVIRNSPDIVAKKLCSQVLHSEGGE